MLGVAAILFAGMERLPAQEPATTNFNRTFETTVAQAREDCKLLWSNSAFDVLRDKLPTLDLDQDKPTWSMLTNRERMRPKHKALAELVIRTLEQCRAAYAPVYAMLPRQVKAMIKDGLERKQDALIAELSLGKITFGEYNTAINRMSGEFVRVVSGLQPATQVSTTFNQTYELTLAKAQADCKALWSNNTFDRLREKIPLAEEKPTLSMLTSKERVHPKDKPLADLAIKALEQCRAAYAPVYAMLPPQEKAIKDGLERKQDALIADLYMAKITFGEYNVKMAELEEERFNVLFGIPPSDQSKSSKSASVKNTAPIAGPGGQDGRPRVATSPVKRVALVIGNSDYLNLPKLSNPENDARSIDDSLRHIGFLTRLVLNASEQDVRREVRKFANESDKADIAFVFYAGHGAQVNGENFLLPIDIEVARTEADIQLTGLKVDDLVNSIRSNTKIVFLDACRDNPVLVKNLVKGRGAGSVGLAPTVASSIEPVKPGGGIFIAYATESGSIAEDGQGKHSPFTQALLRNL